MKVRTKLIIGFSAMLVLLWLFVAYTANNMGNLKEDFLAVESDVIPNIIKVYEIEETSTEAYRQTMYYVLSNLPEAEESYMKLINKMEQLSQEYLSQYSQVDSAEYSDAEDLIAKTDALALSLVNISKLKKDGTERSELLEFDQSTCLPALLDMEQSIHDMKPLGISQLAVLSEDYQQAHFNAMHWLMVSAGLITFIALVAAVLTTRSIVRPLHALRKGTEVIARGNLGFKVGTKAKDEIGQLSRAFDQMTEGLTNTMTSVDNLNKEIAERKTAEKALRESEEKYRYLVERANDGICIIQDRMVKYANSRQGEMWGGDVEDIIDAPFTDFLHPDDLPMIVDRYNRRLAGEQVPPVYEAALRRKDGSKIYTELNVGVINYLGKPAELVITRDLTERKRAEEKLRTNEEHYRLLLDNSTAFISRVQMLPEMKIDYVSPSCLRITGYEQDEFYQNPSLIIKMVHPEDKDLSRKHMNLSKEKEQKPVTVRLVRKDGQVVWVDQIHEPVPDDKGKVVAMHLIIRDITERRNSEEQLKQAMENLEKSSAQLAATNKELEAFSYSVSHDLRSPLRSIDGFSQALLEDYTQNLDDTGKDYLNRLRNASQKMGELIDGLLKLSRLTRSEMHHEEVNLSGLADEIASRLQENDPKRPAEFVIKKGLVGRGDPELLRVLFENLIGNAWKFTSKSKKTKVEFGTTKNGKKTTYFIKDNGAGFDMTYADKLFGAFQRLHDTSDFPGTGIGLATVLRIINRHGGNVWAEGAVNKGATFYFTLN